MIPFKNRFHGHNSLRFVYKNGKVLRSRHMTVKSTPNPTRKNSRIAVVISKKVLKSAVRRNRIRRRVYDYVRNQIPRFATNYDLVLIITSSELLTMPSAELVDQIEQLFIQSELYNQS